MTCTHVKIHVSALLDRAKIVVPKTTKIFGSGTRTGVTGLRRPANRSCTRTVPVSSRHLGVAEGRGQRAEGRGTTDNGIRYGYAVRLHLAECRAECKYYVVTQPLALVIPYYVRVHRSYLLSRAAKRER